MQIGPKGPFTLGDNDFNILCCHLTFLSSSVNNYIGNHATHFFVIGMGAAPIPDDMKFDIVIVKCERFFRL